MSEIKKIGVIGGLGFILLLIVIAVSWVGKYKVCPIRAQKKIVLEQVTLNDVKSFSKETRNAVVAQYLEVNNIPSSEIDKYDTFLSFNAEVKNESLKAVEVLNCAKNECAMNNGELKGKYWKLTDLMKNQFSAQDGSHVILTRFIKIQLYDVDSYEHIDTRYRLVADDKDAPFLVLYTKFRARNISGAVELLSATAKYNLVKERLYDFAMQ